MKQTSLLQYKTLDEQCNQAKLNLHSSQAHGLICGLLSGSPTVDLSWEELTLKIKDHPLDLNNMHDLYQTSVSHLAEFSFDFQLLMPSDQESLSRRAEALTLWAQGFLTGLQLMNIPLVKRPKNEVTEAINDLIEITKMNYDDVIATEEDETAYVELVEYVRMAVIMIYQALKQTD